jgi:hypothetical protein
MAYKCHYSFIKLKNINAEPISYDTYNKMRIIEIQKGNLELSMVW